MNLQSRSSESKKIVARLLLVIFLLESCTNFNTPLHYSQPEEKTKVPPTTLINLQQLGTSSLLEEGSTPSHIQLADSQALIELPPTQSNANYKQPPIANRVQIKEQLTTGRIISPSKISKIVRDQQQLVTNYSITRQESRASHAVAALLINQICIAQGGHQVKFKKQEAGNLKAIVKENIPTGFIRKHVLPVVIESGLSCPEASVKNKDWQKHHIKLVGQIPNSYVWVGNVGLSGGMMKKNNDDSSLPSQKEKPKEDKEEDKEEDKDHNLTVQKIPSGYSGPQWGLSEKEIEYIFKYSKDFVCILEFGRHFKKLNQTWENRLGWDTKQLLHVPYINFVHPDDVEKTLAYEKKFTPTGLVNRYKCKDGSYCWIDWIGLPSIREQGEKETFTIYPLNIGRDVTLQKLSEEKRHQEEKYLQEIKRKDLEIALLTKSNFLAHMSHEIRTPLAGLLGLLELIDKNHLAGEDLEYLKLAYNSGVSLLNILNDILDTSKIEQNQVKIESIEFSPLFIVQEVVQILKLQAEKKGIELNSIISSTIPHNLVGDPTRFRQVLFNLIGNAIKFTSKGKVSVSVNGSYTNQDFTLIGDIIDTGIGISPEIQKKLFQPFFQADDSMLRRFGGTGLGIFISKKLCNLMGGDLVILSSEEGKGSTFRFNVNLKRAEKNIVQIEPSTTIAPNNLTNVRVLVVDDNQVNVLVLTTMLKREGCLVDSACNGLEAVKAVNTGKYDIVLMDGEMPEMDGLDATKKIRESFNPEILPIIGVTAHAMKEDRDRFLAAGMNGYLTKPIQKAALFAEILRCLARK
jgi:PAS domain S-box-containing protein